jgi:beta-glucanase (GH16 family)
VAGAVVAVVVSLGGGPEGTPASAPQARTELPSAVPAGVPGKWTLVWDDEFSGSSLNTRKWSVENGSSLNDVTTLGSNVAVRDGSLVLTLSSASAGGMVISSPSRGSVPDGYELPVGGFAEARVLFPGDGQTIFNWPAWWVSGVKNWPAWGEHDIAEGLGPLTVNYYGRDGAVHFGAPPGTWSNAYHVYGIHRLQDRADVYWDGKLVKSYPTNDEGGPQALIVNVGNGQFGGPTVTGTGSQVKVDYVRAFAPA